MKIVSGSPLAIKKMKTLRYIVDVWKDVERNHDFDERGFGTFVVEGQRGVITVLKVLRKVSKTVFNDLPSPVYTVTSHGPLTYSPSPNSPGGPGLKGYVSSTKLIGSYVSRNKAKFAAESALEEMTDGIRGLKVSKTFETGAGGGMIMGMTASKTWEVRVTYEDQVHKRAREEVDRENERDIGWRT